MVTKTLILTHCHFGCIRSQNWVCPMYSQMWTEQKAGICDGDSSTPGSLHTGSMLSPHPCLRGFSTPGPQFKWSHYPMVPSSIPLQCSVWEDTSFCSFLGCLTLPQFTDHPSSWQSRGMAWNNFEVSVIFVSSTVGTKKRAKLFHFFLL